MFGAVRSLQAPQRYQGPTAAAADANARLSTQINSILCVSRFAHYLKMMGRHMVGSFKTADEIERCLQAWLTQYVNGNLAAARRQPRALPLVAGRVAVQRAARQARHLRLRRPPAAALPARRRRRRLPARHRSRRPMSAAGTQEEAMSGTDQTAAALFRAGKLDDAVAAAQAALRKAPTDLDARVLLAELLVFAGNLERADVVLDAASAIDPTTALVVAEFRQLHARRHGAPAVVPRRPGAGVPRRSDRGAAAAARRAGGAARRRRGRGRAAGRRGGGARARACPARHGDARVRRFARRRRPAGRQLRGADHHRQVLLDPDRARADARIPSRRSARATCCGGARRCRSRDGPDGEVYLPAIYATRRADDRCAAPRPRDRLASSRRAARCAASASACSCVGEDAVRDHGPRQLRGSAHERPRRSATARGRPARVQAAAARPPDRRRAGQDARSARCRPPRPWRRCAHRCGATSRRC